MPDLFSKLRRPNNKIVIQYAIFRWENAVVIAGSILLTWLLPKPFDWWPVWGWGIIGFAGILLIFFSSLTNEQANAQLLLTEFQGKFDLKRIKLPELRQNVETALEYQRRIEEKVRRKDAGLLWSRPEQTADQLNDWIENIYQLALRLDAYRRDNLLKQERESVPKEIKALKARRKDEGESDIQQELDQALKNKQKQWDVLTALDTRMKQAELQLTQSLTALATINSQVQWIEVQDSDSGKSDRIQEDIRDQVNRLTDLMNSVNDVYDYRLSKSK